MKIYTFALRFLLILVIFLGKNAFFSVLKAIPTDPTILVTLNPSLPNPITQNLFPNDLLSIKICAGSEVKLDVISVGTGTLTYQWIDVITGVTVGTGNPFVGFLPESQYQIKIIDNTGTRLSSAVLQICVENTTPINASISTSSGGTEICASGTGTITLTANASNQGTSFLCPIPEFTYKWFKDNVLITGQTNKNLVIANQASGVGTYIVQISNSCGFSATSSPTITFTLVNNPPQNPQITTASGSGNFCGSGNIALQASALGTISGYEWYRQGNPTILSTNSTLSTNISGDYFVKIRNICGNVQSPNFAVTNIATIVFVGIDFSNFSPCTGEIVELSPNIFPPTANVSKYEWFRDGILVQTNNAPFSSGINYTTNLSGNYTLKATNACSNMISDDFPLIYNQIPTNAHIEPNGSPSLGSACVPPITSVELQAVGDGYDFSYIWYKDNIELVGETAPIYMANTIGNYQVKMTNVCGEQLSPNFSVVEVTDSPITNINIQAQGNILSTCTGIITLQTTTILGNGIVYKWYKNNVLFASTNIAQFNATESGTYKLQTQNACGISNFSNELALNINLFPDTPIIQANASLIICQAGGNTTLQMSSSISNGIIYTWLRNGTPLTAPFSNTIAVSQAGIYTLTASNSCGIRTSNFLEVKVLTTPQAGSVSIFNEPCINPITLKAQTTHTDVQFQWIFVNGTTNPIVATTQNYQPTSTGTYIVGIRNDCLPANVWINSQSVNVNLNNITTLPIPTINSLPLAGIDRLCPDGSVILQAQTSSTIPNIAFRWYRNNTLMPNANNNQVIANTAGSYVVETYISNAPTCSKVSAPYNLIVRKKPVILLGFVGNLDFCEGDSVRVRANSQIAPSLYRWYKNGVIFSQSQSISIKTAGTYKVEAVYNAGTLGFPCEYVASAEITTNTSVAPLPNLKRIGDMLILLDAGEYFQWNLNGIPIINANAYQYLPLEAGEYSVIARNELGCYGVSEKIYHEGVASFKEGITISPNPNQGEFRVTAKGEGEIMIQIFDTKGVLLTNEQYITRYNSLAGNSIVEVSGMSSGIYLVRAKIKDKFFTKKVIVLK
jgi:hypothetical protein